MTEYEDVELVPDVTVEHLARAVLFAALTAVLSQLSIQLPGGVPFSFQPFAIFLAGLVLGPLWGGFSLLVYLTAGAAGAPVFSNGTAGLGVVVGPTGGFLVSFLIAAIVIGAIAHRRLEPRPLSSLGIPACTLAVLAGFVVIYAIGMPWFMAVAGVGLDGAIAIMVPLAAVDLVKAAIAVGIVQGSAELLDGVA
jgi:biotin transport system substrate-specific component